jgi:hypothetical protein
MELHRQATQGRPLPLLTRAIAWVTTGRLTRGFDHLDQLETRKRKSSESFGRLCMPQARVGYHYRFEDLYVQYRDAD